MRFTLLLLSLLFTGCASTFNVPDSGTDFTLDGCTPLLNCASSTSSVFLYQVDPVQLAEPLDESNWETIKTTVTDMPGASLNEARFGYLDVTFYTVVFHFPDFFEVLVREDQQSLDVRSQSLIGLYDLGVNRRRIEIFRQHLIDKGIAVSGDAE
ncbi:DUF1499 domain-containing protein [Marinobacter sp. CHS3-4]|uniref:DUF1499 domain-containing protein n=1 Tax=Marinobacter sp. CHS3-4 TaxID=3045174 RepID=UPI0024B50123|nr:DUF1499 domain-containing protein [Marinobacter sp. CHS3-4]MDI9246934.1 DUF1499 domain-containing protein [Marinobacter sp. CHS3-4]